MRKPKGRCLLFYIVKLFLGLFCLAVSSPIYAQTNSHESKKRVIEISKNDVAMLTLENSLDVQIAKLDASIKRISLKDAESIFDTILEAEAEFSRNREARTNTLAGTESKEHSYSLSLEKKIPTGTTIFLGASGLKNRTDSSISILNPYSEAALGISIKQELGKNFFGLVDRSEIKITKIDIKNSDLTSLDNIENALYSSQWAYWNFVLKEEELSIAKDMLKKAKLLYDVYLDKSLLGVVEDSELLAIEAMVEERKSKLAIGKLDKQNAKNQLLFLINRGDFKNSIIAKDSLSCEVSSVNIYDVLKSSINSHRGYKRIKNELIKNGIDITMKKNSLWPQIDLEASLTRNNIDSNYQQAWGDVGSGSNDDISVKISLKIPLENREAKAALEKSKLEKKRFLLSFQRIERLMLQELNDLVNKVNIMHEQVILYKNFVVIHKNKLDLQLQRLYSGRSDTDTLIRYEEDLLDARLRLVTYFFRYRTALLGLELAKNSLLDIYWQGSL